MHELYHAYQESTDIPFNCEQAEDFAKDLAYPLMKYL